MATPTKTFRLPLSLHPGQNFCLETSAPEGSFGRALNDELSLSRVEQRQRSFFSRYNRKKTFPSRRGSWTMGRVRGLMSVCEPMWVCGVCVIRSSSGFSRLRPKPRVHLPLLFCLLDVPSTNPPVSLLVAAVFFLRTVYSLCRISLFKSTPPPRRLYSRLACWIGTRGLTAGRAARGSRRARPRGAEVPCLLSHKTSRGPRISTPDPWAFSTPPLVSGLVDSGASVPHSLAEVCGGDFGWCVETVSPWVERMTQR